MRDIDAWERAHSKYYLKSAGRWVEVTEEQFAAAECRAGFFPKPGCGPLATAGFSDGDNEGRIEFVPDVKESK